MRNTPKEWSRIQRIKSLVQRQNPHTVVELGDDAFVFKNFPGFSVLAQDMMVENIHFRREYCAPTDLGWKALAVNLSDLAAMGANAHYAQVSLALPNNLTESWLDDFYTGMLSLADKFNVEIIGGDLCASPEHITIDVSVFGSCQKPLIRQGACAGDLLLSSGPLGLSHAGMLALQNNLSDLDAAKTRHLRPIPRLDLVENLQLHGGSVHALMDCSDGLINDALQLCNNALGLTIDLDQILLHPEISKTAHSLSKNATDFFLWGGEDYELLLAAPESAQNDFPNWQVLGRFQSEKGLFTLQNKTLKEITEFKGWRHF